MVIPTADTSTSNSWSKQKPGQTAAVAKPSKSGQLSAQEVTSQHKSHLVVEEKQAKTDQEPGLKPPLDEQAPHLELTADTAGEASAKALPDFTLDLHTSQPEVPPSARSKTTQQVEPKDPQERPQLPYTFNFGIRRPYALAVAMSQPLLGNKTPESPSQAVQQTLDLAATNRLPYEKGSQVNLAA